MRLLKAHISFLFIMALSAGTSAQLASKLNTTTETPPDFYVKVKQLGEFIDRFNYLSDWKGDRITQEFASKIPRDSYILYLFNLADDRITDPVDSTYRMLCNEFVRDVTDSIAPQKVSLYSGQVVVRAQTSIVCNGITQTVILTLVPEVLSDRSAKWVIANVEGDKLLPRSDSLAVHFIAPNSHETNFINLRKLNGTVNPLYFFSLQMQDATNYFLSEVARKNISISHVEKVTYLISFPHWVVTVENFERNTMNSGWLISDLSKIGR